MRFVKFTAGGRTSFGIVEGDRIVETTGEPFAQSDSICRPNQYSRVVLPVVSALHSISGVVPM